MDVHNLVRTLYERAHQFLEGLKDSEVLFDAEMVNSFYPVLVMIRDESELPDVLADSVFELEKTQDRNACRALFIGAVFGVGAFMQDGNLLQHRALSARRAVLFALIHAAQNFAEESEVAHALEQIAPNILRALAMTDGCANFAMALSLRRNEDIVVISPEALQQAIDFIERWHDEKFGEGEY